MVLRYLISLVKPEDAPGTWYHVDCAAVLAMLRWTDFKYKKVVAALDKLSNTVWWHRTKDGIIQLSGYIRYRTVSYSSRHYEVQFQDSCEKYLVEIQKRADAYRKYVNELQRERDEGIERDKKKPEPAEVFYTAYRIDSIAVMKCKYSYRLYELLKSHANKTCWTFDIGTGSEFDLFPLLAECKTDKDGKFVVPSGWSNWACFDRDVLKKAKVDIDTYSDMTIEYTGLYEDIYHRQTRAIHSVTFTIQMKNVQEKAQTLKKLDALYEEYLAKLEQTQTARAEYRQHKKAGEEPVTAAQPDGELVAAVSPEKNHTFLEPECAFDPAPWDEYVPDDAPLTYDDAIADLLAKRANEYANLDVLHEVDNPEPDDSGENIDEYALGYFDEDDLPF